MVQPYREAHLAGQKTKAEFSATAEQITRDVYLDDTESNGAPDYVRPGTTAI